MNGQEKGGRKVPGNYYVTGGVHLTANSYPVTTYLKELTATESSGKELPNKICINSNNLEEGLNY